MTAQWRLGMAGMVAVMALLICGGSGDARAASSCRLWLTVDAGGARGSYDPFDPAALRIEVPVDIKNSGSRACSAALALFKAGTLEARGKGQAKLSYAFETASGARIAISAAKPQSRLPASSLPSLANVPGGASLRLALYMSVQAGQIVSPDIYADAVRLAAYAEDGSSLALASGDVVLPISIAVNPVMSVNIAGGGQATTLDFGTLSAGATRSVVLQARSNQKYRLMASSEHGGAMALEPPSDDGVAWKVPYSLRVGSGGETSLVAGRALEVATSANLGEANIPIEVRIGDPSRQRAGRYRDVIEIKIDAAP